LNKYIISFITFSALIFFSCSKKDTPVSPESEDWSFPNSTKFSVTLYCDKQSINVGESFEVKLILYHIDAVLAAAFEINYNSNIIEASEILSGPYFSSDSNVIMLKKIEPDSNRISYGISYKISTGKVATGSGVVMKIKCKAKSTGEGTFTINSNKLEIRNSDGDLVTNLDNLQIENLTITVK
jgi:hypothetical protein